MIPVLMVQVRVRVGVRVRVSQKWTIFLVRDGVIPSLIKDSTPVNPNLTGPFLPLGFCLSWQAVPSPVIFCNLLLVWQNQFMALQPINFTSIRRGWRKPHLTAQQTGDWLQPQA